MFNMGKSSTLPVKWYIDVILFCSQCSWTDIQSLRIEISLEMAEYHVTSTGHLWSNEMRLSISIFSVFFLFWGPLAEAPAHLPTVHPVHPWLDQFTFVESKSILNCLYSWGHFQIFGSYRLYTEKYFKYSL